MIASALAIVLAGGIVAPSLKANAEEEAEKPETKVTSTVENNSTENKPTETPASAAEQPKDAENLAANNGEKEKPELKEKTVKYEYVDEDGNLVDSEYVKAQPGEDEVAGYDTTQAVKVPKGYELVSVDPESIEINYNADNMDTYTVTVNVKKSEVPEEQVTWTGVIRVDGEVVETKEFTGTKEEASQGLQVLANTYIGQPDKYEFVESSREGDTFYYDFKTAEAPEEIVTWTGVIRVDGEVVETKE
ncbi:MAG: hypothetical protein Q4B36_07890, partial [Tissierellia bacterium]|nr:hypothetical protein [Tissierellia bacterium]